MSIWFCNQCFGQLECRQREEEQQLVRRQDELKEDIAGLKDRIKMAQSKEEQQLADLREEVFAVESFTRNGVGVAREE